MPYGRKSSSRRLTDGDAPPIGARELRAPHDLAAGPQPDEDVDQDVAGQSRPVPRCGGGRRKAWLCSGGRWGLEILGRAEGGILEWRTRRKGVGVLACVQDVGSVLFLSFRIRYTL
jgi:hypothetical protein